MPKIRTNGFYSVIVLKMKSRRSALSWGLSTTAIVTTLAITPGFGYDPINLPKMVTLTTGAFFLSVFLLKDFRVLFSSHRVQLSLVASLVIFLLASVIFNDRPFSQQFWGTWGRSTGLLTYICFMLIVLVSLRLSLISDFSFERMSFERLSYAISIYALLQVANLDPINWSQKLMVATLGNINFVSSLLGLACISFVLRIIFEALPLSARLHYLFFFSINIFLIFISDSIQGIGVLLAGFVMTIAFHIRRIYSFVKALYWLILSALLGSIIFAGTLGMGPLATLRQETVVFRLDYWTAAVRMVSGNWLFGVGMDSYGDYYQQFRSLEAVMRTGPQRVTNTAHNIFLDVSSGSGVISGLLFLSLFIVGLVNVFRFLKDGNSSFNEIALSSMFLGFIVFCSISINQIGVGIWGFIFLGFVLGKSFGENKHAHKNIIKERAKSQSKVEISAVALQAQGIHGKEKWMGAILLCFGLLISATPLYLDAQMLRAAQTNDLRSMEAVARNSMSLSFHRNLFLNRAIDASQERQALRFARDELKRDSRSELSLKVLAFSQFSSKSEKQRAADSLVNMDPKNDELKRLLLDAGLR